MQGVDDCLRYHALSDITSANLPTSILYLYSVAPDEQLWPLFFKGWSLPASSSRLSKVLTPCSLATLHPTPLRRRQPEMWSNPVDPSGTSWVSGGSIPVYRLLMCPVWKYNFLLLLSLMAWQPTLLAILQALQLKINKGCFTPQLPKSKSAKKN